MESWPLEKLCEMVFEGGKSRAVCVEILHNILRLGYYAARNSTDRYVAQRMASLGLLRRQAVPVCGEADVKRVYVANRSGLARLRLLLEQLDRSPPACIE